MLTTWRCCDFVVHLQVWSWFVWLFVWVQQRQGWKSVWRSGLYIITNLLGISVDIVLTTCTSIRFSIQGPLVIFLLLHRCTSCKCSSQRVFKVRFSCTACSLAWIQSMIVYNVITDWTRLGFNLNLKRFWKAGSSEGMFCLFISWKEKLQDPFVQEHLTS